MLSDSNIDPTPILNMPGDIWMYWKDLDGRYLACNDQMSAALNASNQEAVIGKTDYQLCNLTSDDAALFRSEDGIIMDNEITKNFTEKVQIHKNITHFHTFKMPLYNKDQHLIGIYGVSYLQKTKSLLVPYETLTVREKECIQYYVAGYTSKETATCLGLSARTIEHYFENLKVKLGIKKKRELINLFGRVGGLE